MRETDKIDRDDGKARKILQAPCLQHEYAGEKAYIPKKTSGLSFLDRPLKKTIFTFLHFAKKA